MKKLQHKLNDLSQHILFVDDEPQLGMLVEAVLGGQGYEVTHHTNSIEALALLSNYPWDFDLVLTDQNMPKMSGAELAKNILEIRPDIPILMCTGFDIKDVQSRLVDVNIAGYIHKPLRIRELMSQIEEHLNI